MQVTLPAMLPTRQVSPSPLRHLPTRPTRSSRRLGTSRPRRQAAPELRSITRSASATQTTQRPSTRSPASGSPLGFGPTTINCNASDTHGNTSSASFTVTVVDTTDPALSPMPGPFTAEATSTSGATVTYTEPTASDAVSGSVDVNCSPASGPFPITTTTVTCTATDSHSNTATGSFTVKVQDTTPHDDQLGERPVGHCCGCHLTERCRGGALELRRQPTLVPLHPLAVPRRRVRPFRSVRLS